MVVITPHISVAAIFISFTAMYEDENSLTQMPPLNDLLKLDAVIKEAAPGGNMSTRICAASLAILLITSIKVKAFIYFALFAIVLPTAGLSPPLIKALPFIAACSSNSTLAMVSLSLPIVLTMYAGSPILV